MNPLTSISILLAIAGIGLIINGLISIIRLWLKDIQQTQSELDDITKRLQRLLDTMANILILHEGELEAAPPEPEPEPEPEPPDLPPVIGLTDAEVWYILDHVATGEGRLSRRVVENAGFSRGDYEKLRDALQQQGYLESFTVEGRPIGWTNEGKTLLRAIRESSWKPSKERWEINTG